MGTDDSPDVGGQGTSVTGRNTSTLTCDRVEDRRTVPGRNYVVYPTILVGKI